MKGFFTISLFVLAASVQAQSINLNVCLEARIDNLEIEGCSKLVETFRSSVGIGNGNAAFKKGLFAICNTYTVDGTSCARMETYTQNTALGCYSTLEAANRRADSFRKKGMCL